MIARLLGHLRRQWIGVIALFVALGGTALATHPGGQNTISTADIIDGQVKTADVGSGEVKNSDIGADAVGTGKIIDGQVKSADIGGGEVKLADIGGGAVDSSKIADGQVKSADVLNENLTGVDVANNSLKGTDIDEATLDVGDAARAYAKVDPVTCGSTPGICSFTESKGVSSVTRVGPGVYCVTAPGINPNVTPAALTVDWSGTRDPKGNASAMTLEGVGCGPTGEGFWVITERQPNIPVDAGGGTNNAVVAGPAAFANDVGFTIVIP